MATASKPTAAKAAKPADVVAPKKPAASVVPKPTPAEAPKTKKPSPPPKPVDPEPSDDGGDDEDAELLALQRKVEEMKRQKEAKKQQDAKAKEREKKKQELLAKLQALENGGGDDSAADGGNDANDDANDSLPPASAKKQKKGADETKTAAAPKKAAPKKPKNPNAIESPIVDNAIDGGGGKKKKASDDGDEAVAKPKRGGKKEDGGSAAKKGPSSAEENAQIEARALQALRDKSNETLNAFENALPRYDNVVSFFQNSIYKNATNNTELMLLRLGLPLQLGEISDEVAFTTVQANPKEIQQDIGGRDNSRLPETIRKHVVPVFFIPIEIFLARAPSGEIPSEFRLGKTDLNVPAAVKYMLDLIRDVKCTGARRQWMKTTILKPEAYKIYWEVVNKGVAFINAGNRYVSPEDMDEKLENKIAQLDTEIASLKKQFDAAKATFQSQATAGTEQTVTEEAVLDIYNRHKTCVESVKALRALKKTQDAETKGRTIEEREYPAIFTYHLGAGDFYHVKSENAIIGSKTLRWSHLTPIKIKMVKRLVSGGHTLSRMSQKKRDALGIPETTIALFRRFYTHVIDIGEYDYVSALNYRLENAFESDKQLLLLTDSNNKLISYPTFPLRYFIRMMDLIAKAPAESEATAAATTADAENGNASKSLADLSIHSGDDDDNTTTTTPAPATKGKKKPSPPPAPAVTNDDDNGDAADAEGDEQNGEDEEAAAPSGEDEDANAPDNDDGADDQADGDDDNGGNQEQAEAMDIDEPAPRPKSLKRKAEAEPSDGGKSVAPPLKKSRVTPANNMEKEKKKEKAAVDDDEILESLDEMIAKIPATKKAIKKPAVIDIADDDDNMDIDDDGKVVYSPDANVNNLLTRIFGDKKSDICDDPSELVMDEPGTDNLERLREEGRRLDALHKVHDFVRRYPNTSLLPSLIELEQALRVLPSAGKNVRGSGETLSPTVLVKAAALYINLCGVVFGTAADIRGPAFEEKFEPNLIDYLKSDKGQDALADMITKVASSIKLYLSVLGHALPAKSLSSLME